MSALVPYFGSRRLGKRSSGGSGNTPIAGGTRYMNGFEGGSTSSTGGWAAVGTGTQGVTTTSPRSGAYSGRNTAVTSGTGGFEPADNNGAGLSFTHPLAIRFAFRPHLLPASLSEEIIQIPGWTVRIDSAGKLSLYEAGVTLRAGPGSTVLTVDAWYVIEIFHPSGTGTLKVRVYADGASPGADELTFSQTAGGAGVVIFGKFNNRNSQSITSDYDDIHILDTSPTTYLGSGKILAFRGNATTPTYDAFTKTSGQRIDQVWNEVPFSATNNASSSANADTKQTIKHNATGLVGVINAVQTVTVAKKGGTPPPTIEELHRINGIDTTSGDFSASMGFSDAYFWWIWSVIPSVANLDGSEAGIFRHAGNTNATQFEDLWIEVDYT